MKEVKKALKLKRLMRDLKKEIGNNVYEINKILEIDDRRLKVSIGSSGTIYGTTTELITDLKKKYNLCAFIDRDPETRNYILTLH